ncbi:hypothetical protein [Rhizobium giardinii]|uniref:hypothetical protein n=1 Tax=Rhizobium giardinii TaxID=56731 RepID=UPI003D6EC22A
MTQGLIYMVDADGGLRRMTPSAPENEDRMQTLVACYPELITDGDGDLLLIRREQAIADSEDGSGRWSLDHLFVTRDAVPVLVELKRAVDTRLRREVVGQLLDYAANATAYWQAGRIADSFAKTVADAGGDPEVILYKRPGMQEENVRRQIVNELTEVVGPLTTMNLQGFPSFKVDLLADPAVAFNTEKWLARALDGMR